MGGEEAQGDWVVKRLKDVDTDSSRNTHFHVLSPMYWQNGNILNK